MIHHTANMIDCTFLWLCHLLFIIGYNLIWYTIIVFSFIEITDVYFCYENILSETIFAKTEILKVIRPDREQVILLIYSISKVCSRTHYSVIL